MKQPGAEPFPGYRLLSPLGRGGFGEVWKCEAPGGLQKAIKFVTASGDGFRQELAAFEQIKAIRHPFLLGLDRVELTGGELVMVMELADCQLHDRLRACQSDGLPGIPRPELLGLLEEVAEALDMMGTRYGLQHLDVKPENLFVVAGHAKVGDYGLVRPAREPVRDDDDASGFTPRYTAPEVMLGRVDTRSDQYSLALVYVELVTGSFPFSGRTAQQLMLQHVNDPPNLSALPRLEQGVVGRALAKEPAQRFPSSTSFVRTLMKAATPLLTPPQPVPGGAAEPPSSHSASKTQYPTAQLTATQSNWPPASGSIPSPQPRVEEATLVTRPPDQGKNVPLLLLPRIETAPRVDPFAGLRPVMRVDQLLGGPAPTHPTSLTPAEYVAAVVRIAREKATAAAGESNPGGELCRFLCTLPPAMVPLKLVIVAERWGLRVRTPEELRVVLWRHAKVEPKKSGRVDSRAVAPPQLTGFEVIVSRPVPHAAELTVSTSFRGAPDEEFIQKARQDTPAILAEIRSLLQNVEERRAHPRYPADFQLRVFPLYPDGAIGEPVPARCEDVSLGGVRFVTATEPQTERIFLEVQNLEAVAGHAVYSRLIRCCVDAGGKGFVTVGRFRTGA